MGQVESERRGRINMRVSTAAFYRHFGFHDLDDGRLWRRLTDIERALL